MIGIGILLIAVTIGLVTSTNSPGGTAKKSTLQNPSVEIPTSVPEPTTIAGTALVGSMGLWMKWKQKSKPTDTE